jgi:Spy/CpxP family protein refolding chaperone
MVSSRRKAYAVIAGVFVLGALAGGGATWALQERKVRDLALGERRAFEERRLEALSRELDLSSEQRAQVAAIFDKHREEKKELSRSMFERCGGPLSEAKAKMRAEIHAVLSPEQRQRYDALVRERESRMLGGHGPRGRH